MERILLNKACNLLVVKSKPLLCVCDAMLGERTSIFGTLSFLREGGAPPSRILLGSGRLLDLSEAYDSFM